MCIAGTLLLLAAAVHPAPPQATAPPVRQVCATVTVQDEAGDAGRPGAVFSAAAVKDIALVVSFVAPPPTTALDLVVRTPNGHVYQRLRVEADPADRARKVTARLPVSGSLIVNSSLYGEWKVAPHRIGHPTACGPAEPFTIDP